MRGKGMKVGVETSGPGIGVHVKAKFCQTADVRPIESAAKGQHETVVLEACHSPGAGHLDLLIGKVDASHLPFDSLNAHRPEDIIQRNPDVTQISFIVPDSDAMIRVGID